MPIIKYNLFEKNIDEGGIYFNGKGQTL